LEALVISQEEKHGISLLVILEKIKEYNYNVYKFIRANGNFQNWDMVLIEKGEFEETIDLHKRERYWIEH